MAIKKSLMFVFLSSMLVMSSFASASHEWWHFWNDEPEKSPFDASVQLTNAPPTIVAFRPVFDAVPTGLGRITPIAGLTVTANVVFIVQDPDYDFTTNPTELPGIAGGNTITVGSIVTPANDVNVVLTAPTNAPFGSGVTRSAGTCSAVSCHTGADADCNAATISQGDGTNVARQVKYTCQVSMQYYDAPGPSTFPTAPAAAGQGYWHIAAEIKDFAANIDTVASGDLNHDGQANYDFNGVTCTQATIRGDCDYVDYFTVSQVDVAPGNGATPIERLLWTSLSVTTTDNPAGDDSTLDADTGLTLRNLGNTVVATIDLIANDLTGNIDSGAKIEAESMSVGVATGVQSTNVGACDTAAGATVPAGGSAPFDGTALDPEIDLDGYAFSVPYTAVGNDVDRRALFFCIWQRLDSSNGCEGAACIDRKSVV